MFKFITISCLLAVSVQCKISPNPAVPYYPQPYPAVYPNVYPQLYFAQPKYSVQPAYVAAASYPAAAYPASPANYRQVFVPASPAYNPYSYFQSDGTQPAAAGAQPGWGEYLSNSFWSYIPNFPYGNTGAQPNPEAEGAAANSETPSSEAESPSKGEKPAAEKVPKSEVASNEQPSQSPTKQFTAYPLPYFGQAQFYGQAPYQQAVYDPAKLNAANNGAVSSFLFPKNIQPLFQQQPQPFADQKYYQVPQANQGTAAQAYQRYLQFQKENLQGQYQQGQFQQQPEPFQEYDQQPQKDESSVVVDSNVTGLQVNAEGQQQPQSKVATGPTIAAAQPQGIAFAGIGGRAGAGPIGTAVVGENATAIAEPSATAISLDVTPTINLTPVHKLTTAYVAKYAPELGVYKVAKIRIL